MIRTIVVDDEWYNMVEIVDFIEKTGFMSVEKQYENPIQALEEVAEISPQVAFIDIEMPEMDGITLAEKLLERDPSISIVFITGWNQYAVQAFEVNALDYIMKPINIQRFNKMIEKIKSKINLKIESKSTSLKIKCLTRLEVSINDKKVIWQRTKAEELFAFLLMNNGNYVHKDTILEYLWPQYERSKALPILQTSICKIRNIFSDFKKEVSIDYKSSKYGLFLTNVVCDYIELENAIADYNIKDIETYEKIEKVCKCFGDGFIAEQGYLWSVEKNQQIHKQVEKILKEILNEYIINENTEKQLLVLELLVVLMPYEEEFYYMILKTLESLGRYNEMIQRIQWIKKKFMKEYGRVLSSRLLEMFEKYN